MTCPNCGSENTTIKESRQLNQIRRRRYDCLNCHQRFTTHEIPVHRVMKHTQPMVYLSDDGMWVSANLAPDVKPVEKPG